MKIEVQECPLLPSASQLEQIRALLRQLSPGSIIASRETLYWTLDRNTIFLAKDVEAATDVLDCHNGKIVGMAMIAIIPDLDGLAALVDNVCVDGAYRSKGIGRLLMQEVLSFARERKIRDIDLASNDPAALALYESMGFKRRNAVPLRLNMGSAS